MKAPVIRSLAAGLPPKRAVMPMMLAERREPSQKEEGEAPVVAVPLLDRSAFLYVEPRTALDSPASMAQCSSCANFVSDLHFHGALSGSRCTLLGSNFPVNEGDSCNMWRPWPAGDPCAGCLSHNSQELIGGMRASFKPYDIGFLSATKVTCKRCRQFDFVENECEFFEELNRSLPEIFSCDKIVSKDGCCNAWNPIPLEPPE